MSLPSDRPPAADDSARPSAHHAPRAPRGLPDARLDRVALLVGWAAALALGLTAWLAVNDPTVEGHAELARRTGELADVVAEEWARWLADPREPVGRAAVLVRMDAPSRDGPVAAHATPVEWRAERPRGGSAFDALLAEAALRERADAHGEALALIEDALALSTDSARRAEGRLRAIQAAAAAERPADVATQLTAALDELAGHELRDGVPYRLLCALAAAPALPVDQRAAPLQGLHADWSAGRLAWGLEPSRFVRDADGQPSLWHDPLRVALTERFRELVDTLAAEASTPLVDGWSLLDIPTTQALLSALYAGTAPARGAEDLGGRGWTLTPIALVDDLQDLLLASRILFSFEVGLIRARDLAASFDEHLADAGVLGDRFAVDLLGDGDHRGALLRGGIRLVRSPFEAALRHPDPDALVADVRGRVLALRAGLGLAALLCAIAGTALARALRRQQRLVRLRSAFVASVSHELRTPVASVLLMAENLADGRVGPERAPRYHALIKQEATRLQRLVHDVLDVSRLERGLPPRLRVESVDAAAFLEALAREVRGLVEAEGGLCVVERGELPAEARWDVEALRRAVLNLVDNALRHGRGDDGRVELTLSMGASDGGNLRVRVSDTGRGLGARAEALFEPFARGGRDGEAPGTGLGLAIVRAIAVGHGGGARAIPAARGACLELDIPLRAPDGGTLEDVA